MIHCCCHFASRYPTSPSLCGVYLVYPTSVVVCDVTRDRSSLNSDTRSCKERVREKVPGFELMLKFVGRKKQVELQASLC